MHGPHLSAEWKPGLEIHGWLARPIPTKSRFAIEEVAAVTTKIRNTNNIIINLPSHAADNISATTHLIIASPTG
jgi:hypothetical protein